MNECTTNLFIVLEQNLLFFVFSERLHSINKDFSIWCHDLLKFFGVATLHLSWKSNVQLGKTIIFWDTTNVPVYIRWPKNFTKNRSNLHGNVAVAFRVQFKYEWQFDNFIAIWKLIGKLLENNLCNQFWWMKGIILLYWSNSSLNWSWLYELHNNAHIAS